MKPILLNVLFGPADPARRADLAGWGLFVLRVTTGSLMLLAHGRRKLSSYGDLAENFPDPLGVGSAASAGLVVFAEFFCAAALVLGLMTRLATVPLLVTMLVAAFVIHADDPWARQELPLLFSFAFLALLVGGGGRFSLDGLLRRRTGRA